MNGQLRVGLPFPQLMHRYRAIAPRPLHGESSRTQDSSETPQGSGSSCSGRDLVKHEWGGRTGVKRGGSFEEPPGKRAKRAEAHAMTTKPFELPSPISLPFTQPIRGAAGPIETKNARYMLNPRTALPFPRSSTHPIQTPFGPPSYPTSSLTRYQSSTTGGSIPPQHFPPYGQVSGGTVLGLPVGRSLSEQVVPTNYFAPRQQRSSPSVSETGGAVTGEFSTPPLLVVGPQTAGVKSKGGKENASVKPRGLVPIAPKSEALPAVSFPFGGVQSVFRSAGGFRLFGQKAELHKAGGVTVLGPPADRQTKVVRAVPVKQEPVSLPLPFPVGIGPSKSKSIGNRAQGSGFRQFSRADSKEGAGQFAGGGSKGGDSKGVTSLRETPVEYPVSTGLSHNPAVLDSQYLEQLYGTFIEPVMVTDRGHQLLWSNAAFQRVVDENRGKEGETKELVDKEIGMTGENTADAGGAVGKERLDVANGASPDVRAGSAVGEQGTDDVAGVADVAGEDVAGNDVAAVAAAVTGRAPKNDPLPNNEPGFGIGPTSGVTQQGRQQAGAATPKSPSNKGQIPVPVSSIQFQGSGEGPPSSAILWVFLKQPGFLAATANPPSARIDPQSTANVGSASEESSDHDGASGLVSKNTGSSSGSSSSAGVAATATSKEHSVDRTGANKELPGRVVTPRPVRPLGSTIRFEDLQPVASNASLAVKGSFELIKRQFDRWSSPVILTDLKNRARWVNAAYKRLVGQPPCAWLGAGNTLEQLRLTGEISITGLEALKTLPVSLKCSVMVNWDQAADREGRPVQSCCMGTRIDSVGSGVLGYLWRFGNPLRGQTASGGAELGRGDTSIERG